MKKLFFLTTFNSLFFIQSLFSHCQMPCGIYHDDMVYNQIDQFVETIYKGITVLRENGFDNAKSRNEFIRWVIMKEKNADEVAGLITTYFLQQKIKPDEEDTTKRLVSAHKLLFLLVQIKQNADNKFVNEFADEWEKFKLMFHVENYECQIEELKRRKRELMEKKQGEQNVPKTSEANAKS